MKKLIYYIFPVLIFVACEDVLDKEDPGAINPQIWDSEQAATLYINALYDACLPTFTSNSQLSDESPGGADYLYGNLTSESVGNLSVLYYQSIRNVNIAIEEAKKGGLPEEEKGQILGQAYFLRAWRYWELVKLYGGVPLVLIAQDPFADEVNVARSKAADCIDQIISDLDEAITGLPASWPDDERGRITRGAAMALKGRVLLFWASPQFNPESYSSRWQEAYQANLAAKDTCEADGYDLCSDFEDIFIDEGNEEFIFGRLYDYAVDKTHTWENSCRPFSVGMSGGISNNPTWDLVKAFPMDNGLSIDDPNSGYDSVYYWKNRDPRFEATIAYNGCEWAFPEFPDRKYQWHYYVGTTPKGEEKSPTTTGFYCKKAIDETILQENTRETGTDWIEIRFAEVLLNLAECAAELDYNEIAKDQLRRIRQRAGIEEGTYDYGLATIDDMVEAVMHERQIELAFENKRHWDLRRRNGFSGGVGSVTTLNGTRRTGIKARLNTEYVLSLDPTQTNAGDFFEEILAADTVDWDKSYHLYFTTEIWIKDEQYVIAYDQPLYNFYAIIPDVLERSPSVEQTYGWDGGTFNPLEEDYLNGY